MQIKEVMRKGMIKLKTNNIKEPNLKSRLLMQYILNRPREYLLVHDDKQLTLRQEVNYFKAIKKLLDGEPLQHITHRQEFMRLMFYVDENVLIPRPDTEILVEEVIKIAKKINAKKILDLCTGSGAIAVSLAKYIEGSQITRAYLPPVSEAWVGDPFLFRRRLWKDPTIISCKPGRPREPS